MCLQPAPGADAVGAIAGGGRSSWRPKVFLLRAAHAISITSLQDTSVHNWGRLQRPGRCALHTSRSGSGPRLPALGVAGVMSASPGPGASMPTHRRPRPGQGDRSMAWGAAPPSPALPSRPRPGRRASVGIAAKKCGERRRGVGPWRPWQWRPRQRRGRGRCRCGQVNKKK